MKKVAEQIMRKDELDALVDEGFKLHRKIAKDTKRMEEIKSILRKEAKSHQQREFESEFGIIKISDTTSWEIPVLPFLEWLMQDDKRGWKKTLEQVAKINYTGVKDHVGKEICDKFGVKNTKEFNTVRFEA